MKEPYNLLSIQEESVIIELPHDLIKFRSIPIKPYFIDNQQPIPDNPTLIQVSQAEAPPIKARLIEITQTIAPLANILLIKTPVAKSPSVLLASLVPVKRGYR